MNDELGTSNPQMGNEQRESPLGQRFARPSSDPTSEPTSEPTSDPTSAIKERAAQADSAIRRVVDKHPIATIAAAGVTGAIIGRMLGDRVHVGAIAGTAFGFMARSAVRRAVTNGLARAVHAYQDRR